jgi:hypothetical protein
VLVDPLCYRHLRADRDQTEFPQIGEQDADDTQREIGIGGDVRDRRRGAGQPQHLKVL